MDTKRLAVYGLLIAAFVLYCIGLFNTDFIHTKGQSSAQAGLWQVCIDAPKHCTKWDDAVLPYSSLSKCSKDGDSDDKSACQSIQADEALSIITAVVSGLTLLHFFCNKKAKHTGAFAIIAAILGAIVLIVFCQAKAYGNNITYQKSVTDDYNEYGSSFALVLVGSVLSFLGGFACVFMS